MSSDLKYKIDKFEPSKAKANAIWVIVGPRNTGKTVLLKDILYNIRKNYDVAFAMCGTEMSAEMCREILPSLLVHSEGYDDALTTRFADTCKYLVEQKKPRSVLSIEDDLFSNPNYLKSKTQNKLHVNGRHWKTSKITCCQHCMYIPPHIRTNVDYVLATRETTMNNRKKLYDYLFGTFPNFKEFNRAFDACTDDHKCLVIDKTCATGKITDAIKWYKANLVLPPFKVSKPLYFRINSCIQAELEEWAKKQRTQNLKSIVI